MKRDLKFAFANSSSHGWFDVVERLKIAILIRERTRILDIFGLLDYWFLEEFWRVSHEMANSVLPFASLITC